jgi:hypothetical protein
MMASRKTLFEHGLALTIFSSRWLQAPLYFGLIIAQAIYVHRFTKEVWHLLTSLKVYYRCCHDFKFINHGDHWRLRNVCKQAWYG